MAGTSKEREERKVKRMGEKRKRGVCPGEALIDRAIVVEERLCVMVEASGLDHSHHDHQISCAGWHWRSLRGSILSREGRKR